ncbi:MAG: hypothetical protein RIT27_2040 [Pseudomonadota bacterium]|jgi:murein tripeptide amidase MpaA
MKFLRFKQREKKQGFQAARFETLMFLGLLLFCRGVWAGGDLLEVEVESEPRLHILQSLAPDVEILDDHHVLLYADKRLQTLLKRQDFKFTIKISELSEFYARRSQADLVRRGTKSTGSMGGFRTFAEIEQTLKRIAQQFPHLVSLFSIGKTFEERDIWALKINADPAFSKPTVWFDALHHAREPLSAELLLRFIEKILPLNGQDFEITRLLHTRNIIIVPCVNPDGYEYNRQTHPQGGGMWRKNRRPNLDGSVGVDLNRNYGWAWEKTVDDSNTDSEMYQGVAPFSELETIAMRDLMTHEQPRVAVTMHTYGNEWMFPWGYTDAPTDADSIFRYYADRLVVNNGYRAENAWHLYGASSGTTDDFLYGTFGTLAYTLEAGTNPDGFWAAPSRIEPLFLDIYPSFKQIVKWGGASPILSASWRELHGNGDKAFDAGESWELQLHITNEGTAALEGQLQIIPQTDRLRVDAANLSLHIAPRQEYWSPPLVVQIGANAQSTELLHLIWQFEHFTSPQTLKIALGNDRLVAWDDMDVADFGWEVSNPQTHWAWHRTTPRFVSPEAAPTSKCWVTGSGDNLLNYNVHGLTLLTSPRFSALGLDNLQLSYRRWFANVGGAEDDRLEVQVSNDNGLSWHTLERIPNHNHWERVSFELEEIVPLSDQMRVRFVAQDAMNDDITEACVDDLQLRTRSTLPTVGVWGKAAQGESVRWVINGKPHATVQLFASFQMENPYNLPNLVGQTELLTQTFLLWEAQTNDQGQAVWLLQCPDLSEFLGYRLTMQALLTNPDHSIDISRPAMLVFE